MLLFSSVEASPAGTGAVWLEVDGTGSSIGVLVDPGVDVAESVTLKDVGVDIDEGVTLGDT